MHPLDWHTLLRGIALAGALCAGLAAILVRGIARLRPRLPHAELWRYALLRGLLTALTLVCLGLALYADRMGDPALWRLGTTLLPFGLLIIAVNTAGLVLSVQYGQRIRDHLRHATRQLDQALRRERRR